MRNAFFFLLFFSSFSFGQAPLTTFFDGWEPRHFSIPDQTIPSNVISSSANVVISIDPSTEVSDVLPTHFGTNMPSFLGGSKLNETDFMGHLKNLGPTYLRYPGGSGSDRFFWDGNLPSAILENDQIDINNLISGTGFRISPFEFKDMLDSTSGEGIVVVNFGYARYGSAPNRVEVAAGYAADFVRHMNFTLGANIKYWEIGNENYGRWEAGYSVQGDTLDGGEYGDIFAVFADSMRSADPTIKIGAVVYPQDSADACCDIGSWTKDVLQKVHNIADFLIVHDYFVRKPDENDVTYAEMLGSLSEVQEDMDNINNMLTTYTPKPAGYFPLAMTEYNSNSGEREISMANAIFIVQALCEQIKHEFGMSLIWDIQNGLSDDGGDHGMLAKSGAGNPSVVPENTPRPAYYIYYLLNNFFGDKLIASSSSDADISCYASKFSGNEVGMVLVNNSSVSKVIELDFGINGIGDDFYWYELHAPDETDKKVYINTFSNTLAEGGPLNYNDLPSYHRLYDNNAKFELKPYSVNFLANSSFSNEIIGDTITIGNCDSYLWNGISYSASGFFSDTLVSVDGFDSIISLDLTIFSLPEVNAGIDQTICEGETVSLSGSGANTYAWDNGVINGASFSPSLGTTSYTLTGTDGNGCVSTDEVEVIVNSLPEVNAGADQTICEGEMVSLSGSGASSYVWDNGVINGVSFSPSLGTTTYALTGTDANGCVSSDQVDVTMNSNPEVSFNLTQDSVCYSADSLELFGLPIGGDFSGNGVNNDWFYPSLAGLGTHNLTYTYLDSLTTCSGSESMLIQVLGCAGILDLSHEFIQVYPNPTFDRITIFIEGYNGPLEVEIYDLKGSLMETFNDAEFSIKEFSKGTYVLRISYKDFVERINIIKF